MKKIIIANWKMNPGSLKEARKIFNKIKTAAAKFKKVETVICPPFTYLSAFSRGVLGKLSKDSPWIGAQDVFYEDPPAGGGAYTGEISVKMLKNFGVKYVIIGHSERREMGETDEIINKKIKAGLGAGLKVVLCVGEKKRDKDGQYFNFVKNQINRGLKNIPKKLFKNLIIAYEPVWAISSQKGARADNPESALKIAVFIKRTLLRKISILYGGSVSPENAHGFLFRAGMDGLLVGNQSLIPENFIKILKIANR